MIAYIKGKLTHKSPHYVFLEAGNIGYRIHISLNTFSKIENLEESLIWTYLSIKEDSHTLFGFIDQQERSVFVHLISVSGIGPSTALLVLSSMSANEVRAAIINESVTSFHKIKGIGPKTAKRIILDLKDKLLKEGFEISESIDMNSGSIQEEAIAALLSLGFQRSLVRKTISGHYQSGMSVEELIKLALKQLSN